MTARYIQQNLLFFVFSDSDNSAAVTSSLDKNCHVMQVEIGCFCASFLTLFQWKFEMEMNTKTKILDEDLIKTQLSMHITNTFCKFH